MKTAIDQAKKQKQGLYACFIDLQKAYDTVNHNALWYKMLKMGISTKFVKIVQNIYKNSISNIKLDGRLSETFQIKRGTRQGCNLSPNLFNIFINDLPEILNTNSLDPITLHEQKINILMYADDMVVLSKSSKGLQKSLDVIANYTIKWGLHINIGKSKILIFNKKINTNEMQFKINNINLERVDSYCYLGLVMTPNGTFKSAQKVLFNKAMKTYYSIRKEFNFENGTPVNIQQELFNTLIIPIMTYGSDVWGCYLTRTKMQLKDLLCNNNLDFEKLNTKFCKNTLGVHKRTSNIACKAELGRYPIVIGIMSKVTKYILSILNHKQNSLLGSALLSQNKLYKSDKSSVMSLFLMIIKECNIQLKKCLNLTESMNQTLTNQVKTKLKELYKDIALNQIKQSTKLTIYSQIKHIFKPEKYIKLLSNPYHRRTITKMRISAHNLPIETGIYKNIDNVNRICNLCDSGIGNEMHLLECTYHTIREAIMAFKCTK